MDGDRRRARGGAPDAIPATARAQDPGAHARGEAQRRGEAPALSAGTLSDRRPRWSPTAAGPTTPSPTRGRVRDTAGLRARIVAHRLLRSDGMRPLFVAALAL